MVVQKAKALIAERLDQDLDVRQLAAELNISYTHFRRIFKHYTNLAPHQYHQQLRVSRAKELLRYTDNPVKSIALALGYENQYYFSRIFKKKTGTSPERWRESTR